MVRWHCSDCNLTMGVHMRDIHTNLPAHLSKIPGMWDCSVCEKRMPIEHKTEHIDGLEHQQLQQERRGSLPRTTKKGATIIRVPRSKPTAVLEPAHEPRIGIWTCTICYKCMPESSRIPHERGKLHLARVCASETSVVKNKGRDSTLWSVMRDTPQGQDHPNIQDEPTAEPAANSIAISDDAFNPPHPTAVTDKKRDWTCEICSRSMSEVSRCSHERGNRHLAKVKKWRCNTCHIILERASRSKHRRSKEHLDKKASKSRLPYIGGDSDPNGGDDSDGGSSGGDGDDDRNPRKGLLHPNGKRRIQIRYVLSVYGLTEHIPFRAYEGSGLKNVRWDLLVTPEDVRDADYYWDMRQRLHNIDTAWGLIPEGGAYEDSDDYFGPSEWDYY